MKYLATRYEADGEYGEEFEAASMAEAEERCRANGWLLDGELMFTVAYDPEHPAPSLEVH